MNRPDRTQSLLALLLAFFLCVAPSLRAQYSSDAFTQKKAGELYDERGFHQNKAITVDGKLVVSNSNGNVSYSYPISSWQEDGYPFSFALNYCGSVAFSTHGEYSPGSIDDPYVHWSRFSQNRPLWILGVNGFAVQTLSLATSFHSDPSWLVSYANSSNTTFDDADFVWTVDGYDICNRMQDFATGDYNEAGGGGGSGTRQVYRDVIHLLRDDGSVLELLNVNESENNEGVSDVWEVSQHLYSGYYVVNEANHPGYARVELFTNGPTHPAYLNTLPDAPRYASRKVHYYPGDGLEYIFLERINPYGMADINDELLRFGGAKAQPTIFYLAEIRSAGRTLVGFTYSRHGVQYHSAGDFLWDMHGDATMGHANLLSFDNHSITYSDGSLTILAFGRTTKVLTNTISYSGNAESTQFFPLATLGYYNGWSTALAEVPINNGAQYKSWVGYVTKIIDPQGRQTTFDYEQYERRYGDMGWPRADVTAALKNYRLSEIVEPTAKYAIKYHNRLGPLDPFDVDGLDTLSVFSGDEHLHPFAFSNAARTVEKRTLDGALLSTDQYFISFLSDSVIKDAPITTPSACNVVTTDAVTGFVTSTIYSYSRAKLPRSIKFNPDKYYTKLDRVEQVVKDDNDAIVQTTQTDRFYTDVAPYLWLPNGEIFYVDGVPKSRSSTYYLSDTVRFYGGNDTLIKYHGMELLRQVRLTGDPLYAVHTVDTTLFTNVPEFDTTFFHTDSVPDWTTMRRRYDSLRYQIGDSLAKSVDFGRMLDDPRVRARKLDTIVDGGYMVPPIFGLVAESWTSDNDGNYLGGKKSIYCLLGDCDGGPATSSWFNRLLLRGARLADTVYGRARGHAVAGTRPIYENANRGLPDYVENTLGSRTYFDYGNPGSEGIEIGEGKLLANDGLIYNHKLLSTSYLSRAYGVPQTQRSEVREYNAGGLLLTNSLTTKQELTTYGLASGVLDPNGWYSEFDYDYNGRLKVAWLPNDFQSPDSLYYLDIYDTVISVGHGSSTSQTDTVDYDCEHPMEPYHIGTFYDFFGPFLVNDPVNFIPSCPQDPGTELREKGASPQELPGHLHYLIRQPAVSVLSFTVQTPQVQELLSLDSAVLELSVASIVGECATLRLTIPAYTTFERTYVLNCEELEPGTDDDTLSSDERIRIPLGMYLDSILDDQTLTFRLETTTSGAEIRFINGYESEDATQPRLLLFGMFREYAREADYTLKYTYDDAHLKSEIRAKVDDSAHSANSGFSQAAMYGGLRRTAVEHQFGADHRLLKSRTYIGDPASPARIDSITATHTGLGAVLKATDQVGDTVSTVYDAAGRPVKIYNQDGTFSTIAYYTCGYDPNAVIDPEMCPESCFGPNPPEYCECPTTQCFGIDPGDQDFYGFVSATVTTNENGVKFAQYYDAFDRLRREIADSGGLNRVTKYEYDILGRRKMVVNPGMDTILYWYDDLGRVRYKEQPDLGTISYAYDDLGNPRFVQTQEQQNETRVTFNQYDDLNRLVIVGEADFFDPEEPPPGDDEEDWSVGGGDGGGAWENGGIGEWRNRRAGAGGGLASAYLALGAVAAVADRYAKTAGGDPEKAGAGVLDVPTDDTLNLNRLTDQLDPNYLHDGDSSAILTANKTLWIDPATYGKTVPTFWDLNLMDTVSRDCEEMNTIRPDAVGPFLRHPAVTYEPTSTISNVNEFENLAKYPENVRIAISYDKLPVHVGPVWEHFPNHAQWNELTPTGAVRNLKGHEAAVAYREHGGEPYHYSVMSYDERGRVEALIRYTENLGFDAVYYQYNSMNQVIRLTVADPLRRYTTWYGYDHNGRVDSVWTKLEAAGSGLWDPGVGMWASPSTPVDRDAAAEITYAYTPTGQVDTMFYPRINTQTVYKYSQRKWLDTLVANKGFADIFKEYLTFDPTGQIIQQRSQQGTGTVLVQDYSYDALGQLTNWTRNPGTGSQATEEYDYDSVGNRTLLTNRNNVGVVSSWRTYDIGRRANLSAGPNQLLKSLNRNALTVFNYTTSEYDPDGSMTERKLYTGGDALLQEERFEYSSWRGLNWKYHRSTPRPSGGPLELEWRYRYNAMGEREQKREVLTPNGDDVASQGYKWNYYLLGGSREQLNLWEGLQTSDATFCDLPSGGGSYVHLYPSEYLVYGVEYPGVREDVPRLRLFPDNTQEYRITDHLASVRATLDGTGAITHTYDYKPFGSMFQGGPEARQSFNSREKDQEAGLFNNGVRKLEDDDGRFTSIDPLWEKFPAWSPYQYGYNNPLAVTDPGGMQGQQLLPLVDGGGGGSPHVAGAPAPPRKDPTPSAFEDPTTVRNIFQMMSGIMGGVVAGAEFSSGYVIITGTGGAALPIGGSLITLSVPTAGLALAQFTDGFSNLFLKDEQEEPAPIPSGVGETGGIVVRKLTGWDGAPFTLGLIETIITTCLGGPPVNSITTAGYGALPLQYGASQLRSSQDQQEVKETED